MSSFPIKKIIQISCGEHNYLALSSKGEIYGWRYNEWGQVGCGQTREKCVLIPIKIDISIPIKFIYCSLPNHTFVVDIEGSVYYWGRNYKYGIQWIPKKMILKNVIKISGIKWSDDYFILNESGKVSMYNFYENKIMCEIIVGLKVNDIFNYLCETEECVHKFDRWKSMNELKNEFKRTNFVNFYDYYSAIYNTTYKTIHVKSEQSYGQEVKYLTTKEIEINPEYNSQTNENLLVIRDNNVFERKFQNSFNLMKKIGSGSFGEVLMVEEITTDDLVAIKKIRIQSK